MKCRAVAKQRDPRPLQPSSFAHALPPCCCLAVTGCKPLKKKDEDLENLFAVSKKKPQQGKKGAAAAAPAEPAPKKEEPAKKKLNHTLETLKTFMQFGIEVPQTTAELAATVAKVRVGCRELACRGGVERRPEVDRSHSQSARPCLRGERAL